MHKAVCAVCGWDAANGKVGKVAVNGHVLNTCKAHRRELQQAAK